MSDFEDLSAKAARLWLEFMQAQAKAAAAAAQKLPDVTRSLAEAGVPLASEVNRWIEASLPPKSSGTASADQASRNEQARSAAPMVAGPQQGSAGRLTRANHRRLKLPKSMARRRARRA
jgi:hypothetical protein